MKSIIINVVLIVVLSTQLFSQSENIISFSSGVSKSAGNGYGILSDYQFSIAEKVYFTVGAGYFNWGNYSVEELVPKQLSEDLRVAEKVSFVPVNVGLKYYFGERDLMPFVSTGWAFNISTINLFNYFANNPNSPLSERSEKVGERTVSEVTYSLGIGCLYAFNDNISGQFEFAPHFGGEFSEGVRFTIGAAYLLE